MKWQSTKGINATLGEVGDRCIGIAALFPGLRWRGASLAVSAFLQPALPIFEAANILQTHAIGKDTPYLAVHWRFEESRCPNHQVGLCFSRCNDGSVVSSGLHPVAKEWLKASEDECNENSHFRGVGLSKTDIIATIEERAAKHSLKTLYLATDGWIRGAEGRALLKEVRWKLPVQSFRHHNVIARFRALTTWLFSQVVFAGCSAFAQAGPPCHWIVEHSGPSQLL